MFGKAGQWLQRATAALFVTLAAAAAAQVDGSARLQLDPGTHWAPVRRLAASADGRLVATASDDKTARVWTADGTRLLHTLRVPVGDGPAGRLYGAAFHPSRPLLAVGGTGLGGAAPRIHFFDAETGEHLRAAPARRGEVKRLVWSRDGRWLVAAFASPGGVAVYDAEGREAASADLGGDCYGIDTAGGTVVATDASGTIHVFRLGANGSLERTARIGGGAAFPIAVAIARDGGLLAAVDYTLDRNGVVHVHALPGGAPVATLRADALGRGRAQAVVWSADGTRLYVGGARVPGDVRGRDAIDAVRGFVQAFDWPTRRATARQDVASDAVTDLAAFADGRLAYASFDGGWGLVAADGKHTPAPRGADYVRRSDRLWVAGDDKALAWQTRDDAVLGFDLTTREVRRGGVADAAAPAPVPDSAAWESAGEPRLRILGATFELKPGEISRALARLGDDAIWGTSQRLARIGVGGRVAWSVEPGAEVRAVNAARDGRHAIAALADGTLRWYRARDGALLATLYAQPDGKWVWWTPRGHYDAAPGAEQLVGWLIAAGDGSRYHTVGRFRQTYYRPDVVQRVLAENDEDAALRSADREREAVRLAEAAAPASAVAPMPAGPVVPAAPRVPTAAVAPAVASAPAGAATAATAATPPTLVYKRSPLVHVSGAQARLDFAVAAGPNRRVDTLLVRRDGVLQSAAELVMPPLLDGRSAGSVVVDVPPGESVVHVVAANANGYSDALVFNVRRDDAAPSPRDDASVPRRADRPPPRGRLFVLAIGIGRYADATIGTLDLPAKDAADFAAALASQRGRAYAAVEQRVLTDAEATKSAIADGLAWLARSVGSDDVGVLFLAGHAVNHANGSYYFIAHDAAVSRLPATAVDEAAIRAALAGLRGRAVAFIDTCHAGHAIGSARKFDRSVSKIANVLSSPENGVIVFASSTGRQESLENLAWGNGAFTKAVVAGLQGAADLLRRGRVTFQGLGYFVSAEVEKLTKGRQTPVLIAPPPGLPDFTLALLAGER